MGFIYKIVNNKNGKMYIGKTSKPIQARWEAHIAESCLDSNQNRPICLAIRKHGAENFTVSEIENVSGTEEELNEREQYWIAFYDTYNRGYNATLGGEGRCLYNYEDIFNLLEKGDTYQDITKELGCCKAVISAVAKVNDFTPDIGRTRRIRVNQYSLRKEFLRSFDSITEAAQWIVDNNYSTSNVRGVASHIGDSINNNRKSAYKFIWERAKENGN